MKKNLHFLQLLITVKKLNLVKNLLYLTFFFISLPVFSQNPLLLNNPFPVGSGRSIQKIVSTSTGKTFFNTVDNNNHFSALWGLWTTDGTQAGTNKLTLTSPPVPGGANSFMSTEATLLSKLGNDKIIFAGDNEGGYGEVWVSNGTQAGTFVLEQFFGSSSTGTTVSNITTTFGNNVVYSVLTKDNKLQLHKTDGTYTGTGTVYDFGLYTGYSVGYFKTIGNFVYFELNNNATTHNEIWRTDGTQGGTYQVKDLGQDYGFASDFMSFANNIYFITISSTFGDYIWKSDGTNVGTAPLKQISTTFNSDNLFPSYAAVENSLILSKNLLYFAANDGSHGKELWKTDGTVAGTGMTFDFYTAATGSNPNWLTVLNNQLYFTANSSFFPQGTALYYYNGSQFSQPISTASNPSNLTVQNNTILFSAARNTSDGNELWITDGSTPNTFEIANINPVANASSNPSLMSVTGNNAYFAASFDANGDGLDDPCIYKYTVPQKIWTGNINTDGSNIDNWFPQGTPANGDNVLFPANPLNNFSNPFLFCKDFINNGSTINVGSGLVLFSGNFYNTGVINNASGGVFGMVHNASIPLHSFGSPGIFNGQFTEAGGVNMQMTASSYIPTLRVEGLDSIYLGPYNFQIDAFNLFVPKIVTDSSGRFIMPVGSSPVTFPVMADTKSYTPVTISNTGVVDYFAVNVKNGVLKNGTSGDTVKQQVVNKTWNIFEALGGGSNATITAQWNAADELNGFNRNNVYLNHYTNGAWDSGTPDIASGSGPYTFSRSGFTSFSPFSISSSTSVLPIHLISFTATAQKDKVQLQWSTATETNSRDFKIQRSLDGINFETIGTVVAAGNSSTIRNYSFDDLQSISLKGKLVFFRIVETDIDGHLFYTDVKKVKIGDGKNNFTLVHNPVQNEALLNYESVGKDEALIRVVDHLGRVIISKQVQVIEGVNQIKMQTGNLAKGIYEVELTSNKNHGVVRMMKE